MTQLVLCLPGRQSQSAVDIADRYIDTVQRADGLACGEVEAKTAMKMLCEPPQRHRSK